MLYLIGEAVLSENIKSVDFLDTEDQPLYYPFKIKCTSCHEVTPSTHKFSTQDEVEHGPVGTVNFTMKCKFCESSCAVTVTKTTEKLYNVAGDSDEESESQQDLKEKIAQQLKNRSSNFSKLLQKTKQKNNFAVFLQLDCRGCEVEEFIPDEETTFKIVLENGQEIENVLEDGELFDYDDKSEEEVSVTEFTWDIIRA